MKWISKIPIYGDKRMVKRFLLFPVKIEREVRWLETAYIVQSWNVGWENDYFTTKELYKSFHA